MILFSCDGIRCIDIYHGLFPAMSTYWGFVRIEYGYIPATTIELAIVLTFGSPAACQAVVQAFLRITRDVGARHLNGHIV